MNRLSSSLKRLLDLPEEARHIGPFHLVRQLGRGGFAPVWLARETYGGTELRLAAVKLFGLDGSDASYRERVVQEARALCQVEHPNIVRFYSIASDDERGVMGVAMEYLTGTSLEAQLTDGAPRPLTDTLALGASIASALSAVHRAALLHRDVKPANVIDSGGKYKLIDFGIAAPGRPSARAPVVTGAKRRDTEATTRPKQVLVDDLPLLVTPEARRKISGAVTLVGSQDEPTILAPRGGTVGYVDPACMTHGATETAASDLYGLGVVLYECAAGKHPAAHAAGQGGGLAREVLEGRAPAPPLQEAAPEAPPALCKLVDALLSVDPARRPKSAVWVAIELERIRAELGGRRRALPPETIGPFRGLGRFEETDRDVYFGRSSEIAAALELLRSHGTVAIVGPSGSGKSSLARAGVLPRIAEGALSPWPSVWDVVVTVPGVDPRGAILAGLAGLPSAQILAPTASPGEVVAAVADRVQAESRGVVLMVDQLEELVTVASPDGAAWVAELLALLAEAPLPGVRALVAARRDLLDPLLALEGLGKPLVRGSLLVEPMNDATWSDVLAQALAAYGYSLEDDALEEELLGELRGTAGAMPLVQFALTELWNKRDTSARKITRAGLRAIGGIAGSLERHADATVAALLRDEPRADLAVRELLLALTTPQGTRATLALRDLTPSMRDVLPSLEAARLVVRDADGVTLQHEALLTQWGRLRGWVAEARDDRVLAHELEGDATKWRASPDVVPLWRARRLAMAEDVERRGEVPLSADAQAFLRQSRRAERRARVLALGVAGAIALTLGGIGVGYVRAVQANERTALEKARVEEQKALLEQQKRAALQEAQAEIDKRQREIEELVSKLTIAEDAAVVADVKRQIQDARRGAEDARSRIAAIAPRPTPRSEDAPAAAESPSAAQTAVPAMKPKEW